MSLHTVLMALLVCTCIRRSGALSKLLMPVWQSAGIYLFSRYLFTVFTMPILLHNGVVSMAVEIAVQKCLTRFMVIYKQCHHCYYMIKKNYLQTQEHISSRTLSCWTSGQTRLQHETPLQSLYMLVWSLLFSTTNNTLSVHVDASRLNVRRSKSLYFILGLT